jgi:hypothetical protein
MRSFWKLDAFQAKRDRDAAASRLASLGKPTTLPNAKGDPSGLAAQSAFNEAVEAARGSAARAALVGKLAASRERAWS